MPEAPPLTSNERRAYALGRRSFERGDDETAFAQLSRLIRTRQGFADVQMGVGIILFGITAVLRRHGIEPAASIGHSVGEVAAAHGGRFALEEREGGGTCARLWLPLA